MRQIAPDARFVAPHESKFLDVEATWTVPARPARSRDLDAGECFVICQILSKRDVGVVRKRTIVFELAGIQIFVEGVELAFAAAEGKINDVRFFEDGDVTELDPKRLAITAFGGQG